MKFKEYIKEGTKEDILKHNKVLSFSDNTDIMENILRDCSKWLKEAKGHPLYRGTNKNNDKGKLIPRKDRKPLDTPEKIHDYLDEFFVDKFGWKARSESVFCSNRKSVADDYGNYIWAIYPVDGYKYIYDPNIKDLAVYLGQHGIKYGQFKNYQDLSSIPSGQEKPYKYLIDKAMDKTNYTDKYISKLFDSSSYQEIMLKCKSYYYIRNKDLLMKIKDFIDEI